MQLIDKYLPYWPVFAGSALFFILGLWWRLSAARAMELAPKPASWVKNYRAGGFPFRRALPERPKLRFWALLLVLVFAGAFAVGRLANISMIFLKRPDVLVNTRYAAALTALYMVGGAAVYLLLNTLFDSRWVSLPGALLFVASAARGHAEGCFLAVSLLFLALYLRAEKPGFPAELLYLCALIPLAATLALRPGMAWLCIAYLLVHWYKLRFQRREQKLSGGMLLLVLLISLLFWCATVLLAVVLRQFVWFGFRLSKILALADLDRFLQAFNAYIVSVRADWFRVPTPGITLDPMVDAPLLGFGFWGIFSAGRLAKQRRDARGVFALLVLLALLVVWLLTGSYVLSLGLTLTTACILRDADLGKKRGAVILLTLAAMLWSVGLQIAGWYVPLTAGLLERLT